MRRLAQLAWGTADKTGGLGNDMFSSAVHAVCNPGPPLVTRSLADQAISSGVAFVTMMQPPNFGKGDDFAPLGRLHQ